MVKIDNQVVPNRSPVQASMFTNGSIVPVRTEGRVRDTLA
jgi:hypothetical protein